MIEYAFIISAFIIGVALVGGRHILFMKKKDPIGWALLKLKYHWWRVSFIDQLWICFARKLKK